MKLKLLLFLILITSITSLHAQETVVDSASGNPVTIIFSKNLYLRRVSSGTELKILSGNVQLRQGNTIFTCDSCVINSDAHLFEAFGRVHIKDSDTADVYSDYLKYFTNTRMAYLTGNVRLSDGRATLTTKELEYDVANKIGTYRNGGRVVNKKSVVTSREGVYYTDLKDIYFKKDVVMVDPAYTMKTDSVIYNSETQIARFIAQTFIKDSSGKTIRTSSGTYDVVNSHAEFYTRTTIEDGPRVATADQIASDEKSGITQLEGNAVVVDTAQGQTIIAGTIFRDKNTDAFLATKKPLMIIKQNDDSIYVTADTLFSARLTELYKGDSAMLAKLGLKEKDSTNRYFEAFRNVRVFSDSLQSVSDSLFYSFKDSTFHLYYDPIVWNKNNQITGDTIYLHTKNKKADRIRVIENSLIVSEIEPGVYNQIKSSNMNGFFKEGTLDSMLAKGLAESVYFLQDDDSAYTGVNETTSDAIDIYFEKGELFKVVFRSDLKGTLNPITQRQPSEARLSNFKWLISRRPMTKFEMFE